MRYWVVVACCLPMLSSVAEAQKNCHKGIPCGRTCISASKTCRIDSYEPPPRTNSLAPTSVLRAVARDTAPALTIELTPPEGDILLAPGDSVLANSIVAQVHDRKKRVVRDYQLEFSMYYPAEGRTLMFAGDVLPLEPGINDVAVYVNGVAAGRTIRYVVR